MSHLQKICLAIGFIAAFVLAGAPVDARLHGGGPNGSSPGGQVTTLDIVNASSSTQSANFVTQVFGHPFKKGDVANGCSGGAPIFQTIGGTNIPFSEGLNPVCWSDGSLKWAPFMVKIPTSINGDYAIASSGSSYNSTTGAIVIALSSTPSFTTGQRINIDGLTGTGNWGAITGTYTVTGVSGNNISVTGTSGYGSMTITGGTLYQALAINILSGGTTPTASGFSPSNLTAGSHDPNVQITGLSNLSGTYVSDLAKGISDANTDNYNYMDGQAGAVQRVRECFRLTNTSGSCHGQLEGYFYVQELPNSSGGFGYGRWMHRMAQPWYDVSSPTGGYRTFSAWATYDGASQLKNMFGSQFGVSTSWTTSGVNFLASNLVNGGKFVVQLTTTGSFPTAYATDTGNPVTFATNTDYIVYPSSPTVATQFYFQLGTASSQIDATSSCTGTCSYTAYPYLVQWGSLFTANTSGSYDFFQGNGSVSLDSHVRITFNNTYWRSTKMIPPYALGLMPVTPYNNIATGATGGGQNVNAIQTYFPDSLGPIDQTLDATGESDWIGPETTWAAAHVFLQDAADEQYVRITSLNGASSPVMLLNSTTHTIPNIGNPGTTYTGMPTASNSLFWSGSAVVGLSGIQTPANNTFWLATFNTIDFSHAPEYDYYALLTFGNPEYEDNLENWASMAEINTVGGQNPGTATVNANSNGMGGISSNGPASRNLTINGTTYYGMVVEYDDLTRQQAWAERTLAQAAAIAGSYGQASAARRQYFNDLLSAEYAGYAAYIPLLPSAAQALGVLYEAQIDGEPGIGSNWTNGYETMSQGYAAGMLELPTNLATLGNYMAKFWKTIDSNYGVWNIPAYRSTLRSTSNYTIPGNQWFGPYITSALGFSNCAAWNQSWSASSPAFTDTTVPTNYTQANGDQVLWWGTLYGSVPAAISPFTTYYKVNVNVGTNQFDLSATKGGSAITQTDSGSTSACEVAVLHMSNTTSINSAPLGTGYMQVDTGGLNWYYAAGGTVDSTTLTDMQNNLEALGGYVPNTPKYSFVAHF